MAETDLPLDDPTALARFSGLELAARRIVEGLMIGQHRSPFKGNSVEFVEHRQYTPGDEIRHIDWRAFGKTGKYYIKEYEEETNLRAYLLVDVSGSMAYGESTISKATYARYLASALGYLLLSQRDAVGLITFDSRVQDRIEPTVSHTQFERLVSTLSSEKIGGETGLGKLFETLIPSLKRRSLVLIFSDFFDEIAPLTQALKAFQHAKHEAVLFQITTPEEQTFPFKKPTLFRSLEQAGHRVLVDPHRLRATYLEQFNAFQKSLDDICRHAGVDLMQLSTTTSYLQALGTYLNRRKHDHRQAR